MNLFVDFLMVAILNSYEVAVIVVLICISSIISLGKHFSHMLFDHSYTFLIPQKYLKFPKFPKPCLAQSKLQGKQFLLNTE